MCFDIVIIYFCKDKMEWKVGLSLDDLGELFVFQDSIDDVDKCNQLTDRDSMEEELPTLSLSLP